MKTNNLSRWLLLVSILLFVILPASTQAQTYQAWVDPTTGTAAGPANVSVNGVPPPGVALPYPTIAAAIAAIQAAAALPGNPPLSAANSGLVHCLPGIYSRATNAEPLPIVMRNFISLQGAAGARATVIKGAQNTPYAAGPGTLPGVAGIYLPTIPNSRSITSEVLIDASFLNSNFQHMIDGITTRGGHVQYYMETEGPGQLVVSNCILDMLHNAPDVAGAPAVPGPWFGFLKVSDYFGANYIQSPVQFLNNTVIMGWQSGPDVGGVTTLCQTGAVGFCDVTDPLTNPLYPPVFTPDPLARQLGFMNLSIQNTIFRTLPIQQQLLTNATALLGVDIRDVSVVVGSRVGPTDAFDQRLFGGITLGGPAIPRFLSAVLGGAGAFPIPWIDVNPTNPPGGAASGLARDPAFVGEFWGRQAALTIFDAINRDWRILPSSAYVDAGSSPLGGILTSAALITYTVPGAPNALLNSFDYDGEAYGNPRIAENPVAPFAVPAPVNCDIGFDEASNLIMSRDYANDSNCHNFSAPLNAYPNFGYVNVGQPTRELITPNPGVLAIFGVGTPVVTLPPGQSWVNVPGFIAPPVFVGGFPLGYSFIYIPVIPIVAVPTAALPPYIPPFEAGVIPAPPVHVVASTGPIVDVGPFGPAVYNCFQAAFTAVGQPLIPTNAQAEQY